MAREQLILGKIQPFTVSLNKYGTYSMSQYNFVIAYWCSSTKVITVPKHEAKRINDDSYMIWVDTRKTGCGKLTIAAKALLPDTDLPELARPDIVVFDTGCDVVESPISNIEI